MTDKKRKKPLSKSVLHLQEQLRRRRETRDLNKRMLIVCEDGKSAPNYFYALRKYLKLAATAIEVVGSNSETQPSQVVNKAKMLGAVARDEGSGTEPFEFVWALVDGDYEDKISLARTAAEESGVRLVVTNKCFEYWILLHYEDNTSMYSCCDDIVKELQKHMPNYTKGGARFVELVHAYRAAADRAKVHMARYKGQLPESVNPCSEVYKIIDKIEENTYSM